MGNSPSTSRPFGAFHQSNTSSPTSAPTPPQQYQPFSQHQHQSSQESTPRPVRRENRLPSIPVGTTQSSCAAPPEPSLAQAQGTAVQPSASTHANRLKSFHTPSFSRACAAISTSNASSPASSALASSVTYSAYSTGTCSTSTATAKPADFQSAVPPPPPPPPAVAPPSSASPHQHEPLPSRPMPVPTSASPPSQVPQVAHPASTLTADSLLDSSSTMLTHSSAQDMYLSRPPRMPLPIEEELHTPGSPIIARADPSDLHGSLDQETLDDAAPTAVAAAVEFDPVGMDVDPVSGLSRRVSNLSSESTVEEEDAEELRVDKTRPTVPTTLEWPGGGDKVYVTGTIFNWNRKTRLHPVEGRPGVFDATINILPGTHHIRFLVDGLTQTSPDLPTTVDFGNNLVNYIEISPDDLPTPLRIPPAPAATASATSVVGGNESATAAVAVAAAAAAAAVDKTGEAEEDMENSEPREREVPPINEFKRKIPRYLTDYDQPEEAPTYQTATEAMGKLPSPPSLPGFLAKPLLNAAAPIKDDNSVLIQPPNHTILNHLATCSIKHNVLAVSATTRYKDKYVTTIIYKPTSAEAS